MFFRALAASVIFVLIANAFGVFGVRSGGTDMHDLYFGLCALLTGVFYGLAEGTFGD